MTNPIQQALAAVEPVVPREHRETAVRAVGIKEPSAKQTIAWIETGVGAPSCAFAFEVAAALATVEHNARREAEPKWVATVERMPEPGERVWCWVDEGPAQEAVFDYGYFGIDDGAWPKERVSHWAPRYIQSAPPPLAGASDD